jgi:nitrate reductase NapD
MADEIHISSLVVHSRPEQAPAIARHLEGMEGVAVHSGVEVGKLVVTLETTTEAQVVEWLNVIQLLDGVLAAALAFHHYEPAKGR